MEGVIEHLLHEGATLEVEDCDFAFFGFEDDAALAGGAFWVVERPQEARLGGDVGGGFLLVPDVVARGDDGDSAAEEFDGEPAGDAASAGGIFAIDDDEVGFTGFEGFFGVGGCGFATWLPHGIAEEK